MNGTECGCRMSSQNARVGEDGHRGSPDSSVFSASFDESGFFLISFLPGPGRDHL